MFQKAPSGNVFLNPSKILNSIGINLGDKVADLGCGGAAYFVLQAARMVGGKGMVYGVDILKSALSGLESKAKLDGLSNVVSIWSNAEIYGGAIAIKNGSLDLVLLIQLLFQSKKHKEIFRETARILKRKGKAVVIDWKKSDLSFGPRPEQYVSPDQVKEVAQKTGFKFVKQFEPGVYHYGLIFEKL